MLTSLVATLVLAAAPACGAIDLDTALALAAARSDEVAIRRSELAAAAADVALADAARWFPSATATVVLGPSPAAHGNVVNFEETNRSFVDLAPFVRIDLSVAQPLYTFGRLGAAEAAAAAGVRARTDQMQDALAAVQLRVVQLFWGEALGRRLLAVAADVEKALAEVDKRIAESLEKGDGSIGPADRYRVGLFHGVVRSRKADAQKGVELAHGGLAATLGTAPDRLAIAEVPLDASEGELPDLAALQAEAERRRPDLKALDEAIAARRAEVRAEEAAARPQFFIAGSFAYAYAPNRDIQLSPWVHDDFNMLAFGFVIGFRQDLAMPMLLARADKARAALVTLERQRQGLARLTGVQVESAWSELKAARERLLAAKGAVGWGRSWFRSAGLDFAAGLLEPKDLLEAYGGYVESQVGLAQASYDLLVARARLAQATGEGPKGGSPTCVLPD